jgi:hypothetical protein
MTDQQGVFAFVLPFRRFRIGQLVRAGNHWFKVIDRKFFGLVVFAEYYKPWRI